MESYALAVPVSAIDAAIEAAGARYQPVGCREWGCGVGCRVESLGFGVQGSGFRV